MFSLSVSTDIPHLNSLCLLVSTAIEWLNSWLYLACRILPKHSVSKDTTCPEKRHSQTPTFARGTGAHCDYSVLPFLDDSRGHLITQRGTGAHSGRCVCICRWPRESSRKGKGTKEYTQEYTVSVLQWVCCSECVAVSVLQWVCCSECVAVSVLQW